MIDIRKNHGTRCRQRLMPSQSECEETQNEVTAGLTPGQGFRWAGAENVDLL